MVSDAQVIAHRRNGAALSMLRHKCRDLGIPESPRLRRLVADWNRDNQSVGDGLGFLPLLAPLVYGGIVLGSGAVATMWKRIGAEKKAIETQAAVIEAVNAGRITPEEGQALLKAGGSTSAVERFLGITPAMIAATIAAAMILPKLLRKVGRR